MIGDTSFTIIPKKKKKYSVSLILIIFTIVSFFLCCILLQKKQQALNAPPYNSKYLSTIVEAFKQDIPEVTNSYNSYDVSDYKKENGAIAKADIYVQIDEFIYTDSYVMFLELFENHEELSLRKQFLESKNGLLVKTYPKETYGNLYSELHLPNPQYVFDKGNILFIINQNLNAEIINKSVDIFYKTASQYEFLETAVPNRQRIAEIKQENDNILSSLADQYLNTDHSDQLTSLIEDFSQRVDCAYASLDEESLNAVTQRAMIFNVPLTQNEYISWQEKIKEANASINLETLPQGILNKRNQYKQKEYPPGTYTVGKDLIPGDYIIVGKGSYSIGYSTKHSVFSSSIETLKFNQQIKIEGNIIMYHIDNSPISP